ncbi:MAG TPA: hypothetical protein VGV37_27465 [Aliidongia sp.]|uniref:hypothetical protein n=1 Tax=Aliidongia sp. TaxID=1914230 RepID=UPI002DDCA6AF|nr:hypothetical protein [Aliidongia sp.]HEV2678297.1 hypothetical protein [Aliidongia sp.]
MIPSVHHFPTPGERLRQRVEADIRTGLDGLHPPEVIEWVITDLGRRYPWEPIDHEPVPVPKELAAVAQELMNALDQRHAERNLEVFLVMVQMEINLYRALHPPGPATSITTP